MILKLRFRGFKTTASEVGGLYAGYRAMKGTMDFLGKTKGPEVWVS